MQDLKVSLIQCDQVWEDKKTNLAHYESMMEEVQLPTDIVVFPEMFQTAFSMNAAAMAETMEGESIAWLKKMAVKYNCAMVASLIIKETKYLTIEWFLFKLMAQFISTTNASYLDWPTKKKHLLQEQKILF